MIVQGIVDEWLGIGRADLLLWFRCMCIYYSTCARVLAYVAGCSTCAAYDPMVYNVHMVYNSVCRMPHRITVGTLYLYKTILPL